MFSLLLSLTATMVLYEDSFRKLIATNIQAGATTREVVDVLGVSPRLVCYYRSNLRTFSVYNPGASSLAYRPRSIHLVAEDGLKELLNSNGTVMLDEIQDWLLEA